MQTTSLRVVFVIWALSGCGLLSTEDKADFHVEVVSIEEADWADEPRLEFLFRNLDEVTINEVVIRTYLYEEGIEVGTGLAVYQGVLAPKDTARAIVSLDEVGSHSAYDCYSYRIDLWSMEWSQEPDNRTKEFKGTCR